MLFYLSLSQHEKESQEELYQLPGDLISNMATLSGTWPFYQQHGHLISNMAT